MSARLTSKALTGELRKLASQINASHFDEDGSPLTNEQALSRLIWKTALGWTEESRDDDGNLTKKIHLPVAWAMQYLFERIEGKAPMASPDTEGGIKAADKVRDLARDRLNKLAVSTVGPPKLK